MFNITNGKLGLTKWEIKIPESKNQTSILKIRTSEYYYQYFSGLKPQLSINWKLLRSYNTSFLFIERGSKVEEKTLGCCEEPIQGHINSIANKYRDRDTSLLAPRDHTISKIIICNFMGGGGGKSALIITILHKMIIIYFYKQKVKPFSVSHKRHEH